MNYYHKQLAAGKWNELPFFEQMANIGSEVERTIIWRYKNQNYFQKFFDRALELLDLTIADKRNISRLRELTKLRETLVDYFAFTNTFGSSDKKWRNYFLSFNYAARSNR